MGKPTICICENKGADQLAVYFTTWIEQSLDFLNSKFQPSSYNLLSLHSLVCVGPGWKPHCWFSHKTAYVESIINAHFSALSLVIAVSVKSCIAIVLDVYAPLPYKYVSGGNLGHVTKIF